MPVRPFQAIIAALLLLLPAAACAHRDDQRTEGRPAWVGPSSSSSSSADNPRDVMGFAGAVTGGSRQQTFGDLESLRRCLAQPGSLCRPRGPVTVAPGAKRLTMAGNVTLDGRGMLTLQCDSYCLELRQGNNVIRGVAMAGPGPQRTLWPERFPDADCVNPQIPKNVSGCAVPIRTLGARQVLIEDSEFSKCGNKCIDLDTTDAVTIRRNRFADSYFGILAINHAVNGPPMGLTVNGNVFKSVFRRSARVAGPYVLHEFANVMTGPCPDLKGGGFGISAVGDAQVIAEGNVADPGSCAALQMSDFDDAKGGKSEGKGKILSRRNAGIQDNADAVAETIPYATPRIEASPALRDAIARAAGRQRP